MKNFGALVEEGMTAFPMIAKRLKYYFQTETSLYVAFMHKNNSSVLYADHQSIKCFFSL